jgi:hypothetical protein
MALRQVNPLTKREFRFVVNKLKEEETKPSKLRLERIRQARLNAKKMGKIIYH